MGSALEANCGKDLGIGHCGAALTGNSSSHVLYHPHEGGKQL